ncbi:hypothetical protein BGX38DRAFT_781639 [Terfezia claveryi]|nr:hypothetical protein BGX38DRAFT_781639 [Terfezia claveryi]
MVKRYEQQHIIEIFAIGDIVSVHVPRQDRHGTDDRRLYCLVVRKPHPNRHALLTTYGLLDRHYPTRELLRVSDSLDAPNIQTLKGFNVSTSECAWPGIAQQYVLWRTIHVSQALMYFILLLRTIHVRQR